MERIRRRDILSIYIIKTEKTNSSSHQNICWNYPLNSNGLHTSIQFHIMTFDWKPSLYPFKYFQIFEFLSQLHRLKILFLRFNVLCVRYIRFWLMNCPIVTCACFNIWLKLVLSLENLRKALIPRYRSSADLGLPQY